MCIGSYRPHEQYGVIPQKNVGWNEAKTAQFLCPWKFTYLHIGLNVLIKMCYLLGWENSGSGSGHQLQVSGAHICLVCLILSLLTVKSYTMLSFLDLKETQD